MPASTESFTSSGTKLFVSAAAPATENAAGYAALTYTQVGEIITLGEFGVSVSPINVDFLDDEVTQKFHGQINAGDLSVTVGRASGDAGQIICETAVTSKAKLSCKVQFADGSIQYFRAKVFSYTANAATGNIVQATIGMGVLTIPIEVDPT
jgi:hypothetical protein